MNLLTLFTLASCTHSSALGAHTSSEAEHAHGCCLLCSANAYGRPETCELNTHTHTQRGRINTVGQASNAAHTQVHSAHRITKRRQPYLLVLAPGGSLLQRGDVPDRKTPGKVDDGQQGAVRAQAHAEHTVLDTTNSDARVS